MNELEKGVMYKEGSVVEQDYEEAIRWFELAAEKSVPEAYCHLALMHEDGQGVEKDLGKAIGYYAKAAGLGLAWAQCRLGLLLATSDGDNDKEAVSWYQKAAEQGDRDAQFNLGIMIYHERGIEKNVHDALDWLKKASDQGHPSARVWLVQLMDELNDDESTNSAESTYSYQETDGWYNFSKDGSPLLTPAGKLVRTTYNSLADKLTEDLKTFGEDPSDPISIVAFHYPMIDFYASLPREEVESSIRSGLKRENDWSFNCPTAEPHAMMRWLSIFGRHSDRGPAGEKWLSEISLMQLCAVCVIGRALESVNIPFILGEVDFSDSSLNEFIEEINKHYPYVGLDDLESYFDNFKFYFELGKV